MDYPLPVSYPLPCETRSEYSIVESRPWETPAPPSASPTSRPSPCTPRLKGPIFVPVDAIVELIKRCDFYLLAAWRGTCRAFFTVVAAHLRERYETCLLPFLSDVVAFDDILKAHGAIVSGSVALKFFLPDAHWEPNDLDIYVPECNFKAFIDAVTDPIGPNFTISPHRRPWEALELPHFEEEVGRVFTPGDELQPVPLAEVGSMASMEPDGPDIPSSHAGIREVRKFYTPADKRVDVITGPGDNPILAVNQFWASLVMNFLRSDVAVCGFPRFTLSNVGLLKAELTRRDLLASKKYINRGFNLHTDPSREIGSWGNIFFGDLTVLVAPFRLTFKKPPPTMPILSTERGWAVSMSWPSGSTSRGRSTEVPARLRSRTAFFQGNESPPFDVGRDDDSDPADDWD